MPGVTASQAVCANTTLSVLRATRRIVWTLASIAALGNAVSSVAKGSKGGDQRGRVADCVLHVGGEAEDGVGPRSNSCLKELWYARQMRGVAMRIAGVVWRVLTRPAKAQMMLG